MQRRYSAFFLTKEIPMLSPAVRSLVAILLLEAAYAVVQSLRQHSVKRLPGFDPDWDEPPHSI